MTHTDHGRPEFATNDPDLQLTVADAVNEMIEFEVHRPNLQVAIASAYFNVAGWCLIADQLQAVPRVRLMLGAEPQRDSNPVVLRPGTVPARRARKAALDSALMTQTHALAEERNLTEFTEESRARIAAMITWLKSGKVDVRRYTKGFLHGKAYLIDSPALGSDRGFQQPDVRRSVEEPGAEPWSVQPDDDRRRAEVVRRVVGAGRAVRPG